MKRINACDLKTKLKRALILARKKGIYHSINYLLAEFNSTFETVYACNQPLYIQMEPTTYCNSKCIMCWRVPLYTSKGKKKPKHMSFNNFKKIMLKLPYCEAVSLNGRFGEPLLNPQLLKIIRFCKDRGIWVSLVTNASLLSENISRKLIEEGCSYIGFSIDTADSHTFNKIRQGLKFSDVAKNIKRFVQLKDDIGSAIPDMEVWAVVSKKTVYNIPQLMRFTKAVGIRKILLKSLSKKNPSDLGCITKNQWELLLRHKRYGERLGLKVRLFFYDINPKEKVVCQKVWKSMFIEIDGTVVPCCSATTLESSKLDCGNILQQDLNEVWNGTAYKSIRTRVRTNPPAGCKRCSFPHIPPHL